jgi:hypothetical protein
MLRLPKVIGLTLCEKLEFDSQALRLSLVGVFHVLRYSAFPTAAQFAVYSTLYGGKGEGKMKLAINRLDTEAEIYSQVRWWAVLGPGMNVHLELKVKKCIFPIPGTYSLSLTIDGAELAFRYLAVTSNRTST